MTPTIETPDKKFFDMLATYAIELGKIASSQGVDRDDVLRQIERNTANLISAFKIEKRNILDAVDIGRLCAVHFNELHLNKVSPLRSGLPALDAIIPRYKPECVYLFCARPGHGKTSLLMTIARNMLDVGKTIYVASAEMSGLSLGQRLIAYFTNFPVCYQVPGISSRDLERLDEGIGILEQKNLYINDTACIAVETIDADLRDLHDREIHLDAIMIDYVQLVTSNAIRDQSDAFKVATAVSKYTTLLAKKYGVPVICAGQQNRESDKRSAKGGKLSDIRGTGQLEQDAHMVAFIHNERPENPSDERTLRLSREGDIPIIWECDLQVEKQRDGRTGWVKLQYNAPMMEFGELPIL